MQIVKCITIVAKSFVYEHRRPNYSVTIKLRRIMERKPQAEPAFADGIGISLEEHRRLANLEWELGYAKTPDGRYCFLIAPAHTAVSAGSNRRTRT